MEQSVSFVSATPLLPAGPNLAEALAFYTDELGFTVTWQAGTMAGVKRGGVAFNLVESTDRAWADNASVSIGVKNLDELYRQYQSVNAKVGPLEMKFWGRREFHMIIASGVCFQFYEQPS